MLKYKKIIFGLIEKNDFSMRNYPIESRDIRGKNVEI